MDDGRTISEDTAHAAADQRRIFDGAREASFLYGILPAGARRSLRAIAGLGDADDHAALGRAIGDIIVQHGLDVALKRASEAAERAYPGDSLATEEDEIAEAVRLVREARKAAG